MTALTIIHIASIIGFAAVCAAFGIVKANSIGRGE